MVTQSKLLSRWTVGGKMTVADPVRKRPKEVAVTDRHSTV